MRTATHFLSRFLLTGAAACCLSGAFARADDATVFSVDFPNQDAPATDHIAPAVPISKTLILPISAGDAAGHHFMFSATSSDPDVMVRVRTGNPLLVLTVDHAPANGDDATIDHTIDGELVFQLFRNLTPVAARNIAGYAQAGFYDGVIFHRLADFNSDPTQVPLDPPPSDHSYILQAGGYTNNLDSLAAGPTDIPTGQSTGDFHLYKDPAVEYDNEIVSGLLYTGRGQLAMANRGTNQSNLRGTNGAQFFITNGPFTANFSLGVDPWSKITTDGRHRESFQCNYTLFGQLTHGWSILDKLQQVGLTASHTKAEVAALTTDHGNDAAKPDPTVLGISQDLPKKDVVITGARVVQQYLSPLDGKTYTDAVLILSAKGPATAQIKVTPSYLDDAGNVVTLPAKTFNAYAINDNFNDPPTLSTFEDQVAPPQTRIDLPYEAIDLEHDYISLGTKLYDLQNPSNTSPAGVLGLVRGDKIAFQGAAGFGGQVKGLLGAFSATQYDSAYRGAIDGAQRQASALNPIGYDVGDRPLITEAGVLQGTAGQLIPGCVVARFLDSNPAPRSTNAAIVATVAWGDGTPPDTVASIVKDTTLNGPALNRYQVVATDKPTFIGATIPDPRGLAARLVAHTDPVSAYIWSVGVTSQSTLTSATSSIATLRAVLASLFNQVAQGGVFYTDTMFAGVTLSSDTLALKATNPTAGADLVRLNRLLLNDAYPGNFPAISKSPGHVYQKPGIYTVTVSLTNGLGMRKIVYSTAVVRTGSISLLGREINSPNGRIDLKQPLAIFTDTNGGSVNNFAAEIDWGDGVYSQGEIARLLTGEYTIKGEKDSNVKKGVKVAHAYVDAETFAVSVHLLKYDRDASLSGKVLVGDAYAWSTVNVAKVKGAVQHMPPFDQVHLITAVNSVANKASYAPGEATDVPIRSTFIFSVTVLNAGNKTFKAMQGSKRAVLSVVLSLAPDFPNHRSYVQKDVEDARKANPNWEIPLKLYQANTPFNPKAIPIPKDLKPGDAFTYTFDKVNFKDANGKNQVLDYRLKGPDGLKLAGYNLIAYVGYSDPIADHEHIDRFAASGKFQGILINGKRQDPAPLVTDESAKVTSFEVSLDTWPDDATGTVTIPITTSSKYVAKVDSPNAVTDTGGGSVTFTKADFGGSAFTTQDFVDPRAMALRLTAANVAGSTDLVANYLISKIPPSDQTLLANTALPLDQLTALLVSSFNTIINAEYIYSTTVFASVPLSARSIELKVKTNRTPNETVQLNHYLIQNAFPVLINAPNIRVVTIAGVSDTPDGAGASNPTNSAARSFTITVGPAVSSVDSNGKIENPYYDQMPARLINGSTADISKNITASVTALGTSVITTDRDIKTFTVTLAVKPTAPVVVQIHANPYLYQGPAAGDGTKPDPVPYAQGLLTLSANDAQVVPFDSDTADTVTLVFDPADTSLVKTVWLTGRNDGHTGVTGDPLASLKVQTYKITFDPATSTPTDAVPTGDKRFISVKPADITVTNTYAN